MVTFHGPKPYKFTGFGDIPGPKPYIFIGFGDIHGPKPYKFIGFGAIRGVERWRRRSATRTRVRLRTRKASTFLGWVSERSSQRLIGN